jgi:hypothetical protein
VVVHTCHLTYSRCVNRRIKIQADLAINEGFKITKANRAGGMVQVVSFPSKYEA